MATEQAPTVTDDPGAVLLPLPLGRSAYLKLVQVARREGLDASTLAANMVMYNLGATVATSAIKAGVSQRPGTNGTSAADLRPDLHRNDRELRCMSCGRGRPASNPPRCPQCGGTYLTL